MGVELHLNVNFRNVTRKQWEAVYDETVELIDHFPFLDKIVDDDSYAESFIYADRTKDRYLTPWFPELRGWYTMGDLRTFEYGEPFFLIRDIGYYRDDELAPDSREIYFNLLNMYGGEIPELDPFTSSRWEVFRAKTQGLFYHKFLLAIAALIEDRLKPHAMVNGDITREQLQNSIQWANKYLETPISLPDRCSYTRLLPRIKKQVENEKIQLRVLFFLLLYPRDQELGHFIRENISREVIREYWAEVFQNTIPTLIDHYMAKYLDMHFPLDDLFTILTTKDYDFTMTPDECLLTILKKRTPKIQQLENIIEPETDSSLSDKSDISTKEIRDSALHFIEESELKEIVSSVLREKKADEVDLQNRKRRGKQDPYIARTIEYLKKLRHSSQTGEPIFPKEYDIEENAELIYWKEGNSIHPNVEEDIQKMLDISDSVIEELKHNYGEKNEDYRMQALLKQNRNFLIRKDTWDYIRSYLLDDTVYIRFLSLITIEIDDLDTRSLLKSICNNLDFLTHHVLSRPISV